MPTVTYRKSELKKLIGKRLSDNQLAEVITLIKPNLEKTEGDNITIEHTADRPDLFSTEGLARAVVSYLNLRRGLRKYSVFKPKVQIKINSVPVRPYVSAAVVRNAKMDGLLLGEMISMQELLSESIGRKRSKVAIGMHDLDKIRGPISYSGSSHDEEMVPLDQTESMKLVDVLEKTEKGKEYGNIINSAKLLPVFKDSLGIFSFAPILNSERTRVAEKSRNLLIEMTGTDKQAVNQIMNIFVTGLAERKFSIESVKLKYEKRSEVTPDLSESVSEISVDMVNKILGLQISAKEIMGLLNRMGHDAVGSADRIEVIIPAYRVDILHPADIVEDIAIAYGYNNFRPEMPNISTLGKPLELEDLCEKASTTLIGFGFQEILSSALSNPKDQFEKMNMPQTEFVEIANPSSSEYTYVRTSLLPGLLRFLSANKHYEYPQNIFETGDVAIPDKVEETLARNERRVGGVICHSRSGFAELKSVVDNLMKNLELGYSTKECDSTLFIPGRGVDIYLGKKFIGSFGELHPQVIQNWEIGMPISAFEINLESL